MHTYTSALSLIGVAVPPHLQADADVPILCAPQAQGDLLIFPVTPPPDLRWEELQGSGVQVIHGEATGNTHWLHPGFDSPGVCWSPVDPDHRLGRAKGLTLGYVRVPDGQSALLIHTDEHGANGIGPGSYAIHGKRQLRLATAPQDDVQASRHGLGSVATSSVTQRKSLFEHAASWDFVVD
jgi:hypothetical protein